MKKLLLPLALWLLTFSTVNADEIKTLETKIEDVKQELKNTKETISNRAWYEHIFAYFTTKADEETKIDKLERQLARLQVDKKNTQVKKMSTEVRLLNQTSQYNMETKKEEARKAKEAEEARKAKEAEDARKAEEAKKAKEAEDARKAEEAKKVSNTSVQVSEATSVNITPSTDRNVSFGSDGLLVMQSSARAQQVINQMSNGTGHVTHTAQLDAEIDQLTAAEAMWVMHRIEGAGFGQTGSGYAGIDTPESHRTFVEQQLNKRFDGSIHTLLKKWGTFNYGGY